MEAFSLLKYWRGGGVAAPTADAAAISANMRTSSTSSTTTILTAVNQNSDETDDDEDSDGDDGPFFDLEFAVPDEDEAQPQTHKQSSASSDESDEGAQQEQDSYDDDDESDDGEDGEREFKFTVSSGSSLDRTEDPNLTLSPSDDLFFKGKLVPIEPSSIEFNPSEESNSKPQFAVSLLKSATKLRVFMLGLKKSKSNSNGSEKTEPAIRSSAAVSKGPPEKTQEKQQPEEPPQQGKQKQQGKLFTVKLKVEEVPIVSLFTRDNSSRISTTINNSKSQSQALNQQKPISTCEESASEEKRFSKEVMQKYLKMVKPLYVRVSKRYGEKLRLSGQLSLNGSNAPATNPAAVAEQSQSGTETSEAPTTVTTTSVSNLKSSLKQGNFPAGLRVVCKHLGKSRSASSAVAAAPSGAVVSQRRDDSLLQQQDGIQSAILHCKRSFNASRDSDSTLLSRCVSDPSNEKSGESSDQGKAVRL